MEGDARHSVCFTLCGIAALAGCSYSFELPATDAYEPADLRCGSWAATHVDLCEMPMPVAFDGFTIAGRWTFDTTTLTLRSPAGDAVDLPAALIIAGDAVGIAVRSLHVPAGVELRVVGSVPLVIASFSDIAIDGVVDVASYRGDTGAAANTSCSVNGASDGSALTAAGGGGGGGGHGTAGGDGGYARVGKSVGAQGRGGVANLTPHRLRGGCPGGSGGIEAGPPGDGGGAIHFIARDTITISGSIIAGGSGGDGARVAGGGGSGGGSGGLVDLEAETIITTAAGVLAANGGGGGGGNDVDDTGVPGAGADATTTDVAAAGGVSAVAPGGAGGSAMASPGDGETPDVDNCGGGGGGGAVGVIAIHATTFTTSGSTSPAATMLMRATQPGPPPDAAN